MRILFSILVSFLGIGVLAREIIDEEHITNIGGNGIMTNNFNANYFEE